MMADALTSRSFWIIPSSFSPLISMNGKSLSEIGCGGCLMGE
jgi:hypothetical protein